MSRSSVRTLSRTVAVSAAVAALAGCGGFDATTSSPASTTATTTPVPPAAPQTTSSSDDSATCRTSQLKVALADDQGGGAAGSTTSSLTFTNTGDDACVIYGWPGVSYVGKGDGTQLGEAAVRQGKASPRVLEPGKTAAAPLREATAQNYPSSTCHPVKADGLRIYPPNQTAAVYLPHATTACSSSTVRLLTVQPVTTN